MKSSPLRVLALIAHSSLAVLLVACSSGDGATASTGSETSSTTSSSSGGGGGGSGGTGGAAPAPWSYGNAKDEEAYCALSSKAKATGGADCSSDPLEESVKLEVCEKYLPCDRAVYEPDFMERQRQCFEDKLTCKSTSTVRCEVTAAETYPDGAQLRSACAARRDTCDASGKNFDINCPILGALLPAARQRVAKCFTSATTCGDADDCVHAELGPPCDAL